MAVSLRQGPVPKQLALNKHGIIRGSLIFTPRRWMFLVSNVNVKVVGRYLPETRI